MDIQCWDQYHPTGTNYLFIFKNLCYNKNLRNRKYSEKYEIKF